MAESQIYRLDKNFPVLDYKGREVSVLNWIELEFELKANDDLLETLVEHDVPYGTYCIESPRETQYFEYYDASQVPDAQFDIYFYNSEPMLGAFGIHWAATQTVGRNKRERFIGPVFSTREVLELEMDYSEFSFVGDLLPDLFMEELSEQFHKEKKAAQKRSG